MKKIFTLLLIASISTSAILAGCGTKEYDDPVNTDVYKRQIHNIFKTGVILCDYGEVGKSARSFAHFVSSHLWTVAACAKPVSYTHLDVYKRQAS